jgi:hypothetical protein
VRRVAGLAAALVALAIAGGCGGDDAPEPAASAAPAATTTTAPGRTAAHRPPHVPCPAGLAGCRSASGTIIYVERVDPDGDGDAHFVLASPQSVTLPGISVIDVAVGLRPHPLPGPGEQLAAAGQVQTGSYGQSQIHAVAVEVAG